MMEVMEDSSFLKSIYLDTVKSYFTDNDWEKLTDYEKIQVIMLYEMYKVQVDHGLTVEPPSYMRPKEIQNELKEPSFNETDTKNIEIQPDKESDVFRYSDVKPELVLFNNKKEINECKLCNKKFVRPGSLRNHYLTVHGEKIEAVNDENAPDSPKYKCPYCDNHTYICKRDLTRHINLDHPNTKKHICDICKYGTIWEEDYNVHLHTEHFYKKKIYSCKYCDHSTPYKQNLNTHVQNVHLKKHECNYCPFSTSKSDKLTKHINKVHLDNY